MQKRLPWMGLFLMAAVTGLAFVYWRPLSAGQQEFSSPLGSSFVAQNGANFPTPNFAGQNQAALKAQPVTVAQGNLLMSTTTTPNFQQQIVLVDTATKTMAVYHVSPDTGLIALKSVRRMDGDLALDEFNGTDPSPTKVRAILSPR